MYSDYTMVKTDKWKPLIQAAEQYRLLSGMNNAEFSRVLGISDSLWYKIKASERNLSKDVITKLSNLNVVCEKIARQLSQEPCQTAQNQRGWLRSLKARVLAFRGK